MKNKPIIEIGEFQLLENYIKPILSPVSNCLLGDDCAIISIDKDISNIVITTDATPRPIVMNLEYESLYAWGWYTVAINISDLATTGCRPISISTSIDFPDDLPLYSVIEFFEGIRDACLEFKVAASGGNIRSGKLLAAHATATGVLKKGEANIGRSNCKAGDVLVSIGQNGIFISTYLRAMEIGYQNLSKGEKDILVKPKTQIFQMQQLCQHDLFSAASDNSDGVLGAIWNIAEKSDCGFYFDFNNICIDKYVMDIAEKYGYNPINLFLFWGDWQVITTIKKSHIQEFKNIANKINIEYTILGEAFESTPKIIGCFNDSATELNLIRNENFVNRSFNGDTLNHLDYMLKSNIKNEN